MTFVIPPKNIDFYNEAKNICDSNFMVKENFIPIEINARNFVFHLYCGDLIGAVKFENNRIVDGFVIVEFTEDHMRINGDTMVELLYKHGFEIKECEFKIEEKQEKLILC